MTTRPLVTVAVCSLWLTANARSADSAPSPSVTLSSAPLTTIAEAFVLWPELARDDVGVHFEGVVTSTMPNGAFRMHDGHLGIYVRRSAEGLALTPGDRISISGRLLRNGFSPWIAPEQIVVHGKSEFPPATPASYSLLAAGTADNQWVEIEGVVRAAEILDPPDFISLDLGMSGGNLRVLVNRSPHPDLESLVGATVRIRGVAAVNVNRHGHVVEPSFRAPSFAEVVVIRPAPGDPFAQPSVPVARLLRPLPGATYQHRVKTEGVVTRQLSDTMFFIRDGNLGLKVTGKRLPVLQPGDRVELVGFPAMADGMAVLEQAVAHLVGRATRPVPAVPAWSALIDGTHNSDLVTVQARLVDRAITGSNITLIFEAGDRLFKGLLNHAPNQPLALPEKNSVVDVTGVCVISELEDIWFYQPRSFLLLLASAADLTVVEAPPWWNADRLWRALAITGLILLAATAWVGLLRRRIDRKRAVIEEQTRHTAALEERSRIARDLHDTLEQGLTGLSLQMKAMETDFGSEPHPARARLAHARQMLRQSRALARNAIRELRSEAVPPRFENVIQGLQLAAESWNRSGALTVAVAVKGTPRPLPPRLEDHLLGIGTEAMTNAVKHGRAEAIQVELDFRADEVALRITDNGAGFDPDAQLANTAGSFGLVGMRERAREVGGALRIHSRRGNGTEVVVAAPLAFDAGAGGPP